MRILIHPGFHKTGTTSLQRGAGAQRETLAPRLRLFVPSDIENLNFAARRVSVGVTDTRLAAFRAAAAGLAGGLAADDPRPVLISSEHLCGLMPGRRSVTDYAAAPLLLANLVAALRARMSGAEVLVWFTTRAAYDWLRSLYWQCLRSDRITEDLASFSRRFARAAALDDTVAAVRARLAGQAQVMATRLEACGARPLGPLGVALEVLGVAADGLAPVDVQNVQPGAGADRLLALNRSDLDEAALAEAKSRLLVQLRRDGKTRRDGAG